MTINPLIQAPHGLEVVLHPLLEFLRYLVEGEEVLEVPPLGLVQGLAGVHSLDDGSHVSEDGCVHQGCSEKTKISYKKYEKYSFTIRNTIKNTIFSY